MFKSPANEFFSHMYRKIRKFNYFNRLVPVNEFLLPTVGAIEKLIKIDFTKFTSLAKMFLLYTLCRNSMKIQKCNFFLQFKKNSIRIYDSWPVVLVR